MKNQNSQSGMNQNFNMSQDSQAMTTQNPYYNKNNSNNGNRMNKGTTGRNSRNNSNGMNAQMNSGINQNPYMQAKTGFSTTEILTGILVGAAATYVLTNENVQKTLFKSALSIGDILSGGLDEMKERFEDAKAEREAQKEA